MYALSVSSHASYQAAGKRPSAALLSSLETLYFNTAFKLTEPLAKIVPTIKQSKNPPGRPDYRFALPRAEAPGLDFVDPK